MSSSAVSGISTSERNDREHIDDTERMPAGRQDRLVLVMRHAEAGTDPKRYAHHPSMGLSPRGEAQAHEAAVALADCPIGAIVASPFARAARTAEEVAAAAGISVDLDRLWVERSFPAFYGMTYIDIESAIGPARLEALVRHSEDFEHPSGESLSAARARVSAGIKSVCARARIVLVVTHGGPHGWLMTHVLGISDPRMGRWFNLHHAHLSVLSLDLSARLSKIVALNVSPAAARGLVLEWVGESGASAREAGLQ